VPLAATKGYSAPEVQQAYARARELCESVSEESLSFTAVYGLWRFYLLRAEYTTANELAKQLLASAARSTDVTCHVLAHRANGATALYMGDIAAARADYESVREYKVSPEEHTRLLAGDVVDPWVASYSYNGWALWLLGRPDAARREIDAALALARRIEHPFSIALALSFASWLHQFCGDAQRTRTYTDEALALSTQHAFRFWIGWGKLMRAWTLMELEDAADAPELMREGLAQWEATGSRLGRSYFLGLLSEACARRDDPSAVAATLIEAATFAVASHERWWEAELHRLHGELHGSVGREAEAEASFCRALEVSQRQGALSLELRAATSLARLRIRQGRRDEARELVTGVLGRFTEGFDTRDLRSARALLDEPER
jgi:adenylate cyclase